MQTPSKKPPLATAILVSDAARNPTEGLLTAWRPGGCASDEGLTTSHSNSPNATATTTALPAWLPLRAYT